MVKETIDYCTSSKIASMIVEPIQGAGGIYELPDGFFAKSAEHVRAAEGLVHADEVQTGFGRCGTHYWGFEQHNITPDMVTMAKGIANGMPMAVVAMSKDIANSMDPKKLTFQTYSVNPLSIAAGREVLRVIDDEGLMENSLKRGNQFIKGLTELQSVHK